MNDWQRHIGVGQRQVRYGQHAGHNRTIPVVADDGPLRGREVGARTEHWSGRVDAKVTAASITANPILTARKASE